MSEDGALLNRYKRFRVSYHNEWEIGIALWIKNRQMPDIS